MIAGVKTRAALDRLSHALQRLEAAVAVQREASADVAALADDRVRLEADRARLADALNTAQERAARLAEANDDVTRRLITIMERLRRMDASARWEGDEPHHREDAA